MTGALALLLLVVSAAACSPNQDRSKNLAFSLKDYNEAVRWKQFRTAVKFVDPVAASKIARKLRKATMRIDLTDVELVDMDVAPDGNSATCLVQFSWFETGNLTVRTGYEVQDWHKISDRWLMTRHYVSEDKDEPPSPFVKP